jgi:hypothetical protein
VYIIEEKQLLRHGHEITIFFFFLVWKISEKMQPIGVIKKKNLNLFAVRAMVRMRMFLSTCPATWSSTPTTRGTWRPWSTLTSARPSASQPFRTPKVHSSSVAEPHHFYAAPTPGKNFDAAPAPAPAPAPTLLNSKAKFLKLTKV